jgi:hypothetical protein
MRLKHVDLITNSANQDAWEVKTKFSKIFNTFFFPVGEEVLEIVAAWVSYLRDEKLWGNDDPLFPATRITLGATRQFEAAGCRGITGATPRPFVRSFAKPLFVLACRISTRIASEIPLSNWARMSVKPPNSSRRGARTSDTRKS